MEQPNFNESVSAEIRAEMGRQQVTQYELAQRLNWAQSQLSRRLRGLVPLSTEDIERIAAALGVPIHELTSPRAAAS